MITVSRPTSGDPTAGTNRPMIDARIIYTFHGNFWTETCVPAGIKAKKKKKEDENPTRNKKVETFRAGGAREKMFSHAA